MTVFWIGAVVSLFVLLLVMGRSHARAMQAWTAPEHGDNGMAAQFSIEAATLEGCSLTARRAVGEGDVPELLRVLEFAGECISREAVPDRLKRLRAMGQLARMAAAILPAPPVPWRAFKLRSATGVAGVASVLHHFLVSTHERLWLRLQVLGAVFRLAGRAIDVATRRAPRHAEGALELFDRAASDWKTGDAEMIASLRLLLTSLAARPRPQAVAVER